jgi:hypothetical protein
MKIQRWMRLLVCGLAGMGLLFLSHCASGMSSEEKQAEKLLDRLTVFVEAVQADQWERALGYTTATETRMLLGDGAALSEDMKIKLKALKLSTLAHRGKVHLVKDRLEGIHLVLPGGLPSGVKPASDETREEVREEVPSFQ